MNEKNINKDGSHDTMTRQSRETIAVCVSRDIVDFINEGIESRRFADASHAIELMVFEHMKNVGPRDQSALNRIERLAQEIMKRSVDMMKETADTVQETTRKLIAESTEMIRTNSMGKVMADSAGRIQEGTQSALKYSRDLMEETMEKVRGTLTPAREAECECGQKDCDCAEKGKKIQID